MVNSRPSEMETLKAKQKATWISGDFGLSPSPMKPGQRTS